VTPALRDRRILFVTGFVPSLGRTAVPACMPLELTPTAP
jgi:hypothetical protein